MSVLVAIVVAASPMVDVCEIVNIVEPTSTVEVSKVVKSVESAYIVEPVKKDTLTSYYRTQMYLNADAMRAATKEISSHRGDILAALEDRLSGLEGIAKYTEQSDKLYKEFVAKLERGGYTDIAVMLDRNMYNVAREVSETSRMHEFEVTYGEEFINGYRRLAEQNRIAANMTYVGFQSSRRKIQKATDVTIRINREITRVSKIISDLADQRSKIYGDAHEAGVRL